MKSYLQGMNRFCQVHFCTDRAHPSIPYVAAPDHIGLVALSSACLGTAIHNRGTLSDAAEHFQHVASMWAREVFLVSTVSVSRQWASAADRKRQSGSDQEFAVFMRHHTTFHRIKQALYRAPSLRWHNASAGLLLKRSASQYRPQKFPRACFLSAADKGGVLMLDHEILS